jgi:branched-chain amino acid transport system ATP-binding protein
MLEVRNLSVARGKSRVVENASFSVPRGTVAALVGPNGAGKTSLVRALSGLLKPAGGSVVAQLRGGEVELTGLEAHEITRRGVSHVPEGRGLFTTLSVRDNLIAGSMFPRARAERAKSMEFVLELFPRLRERPFQMSGSLSGGEQQMVAVGRALMACPELLILDEPSIGLAPQVVAELYRALEELKRRTGITLLIVEQDIPHVARICDAAWVMAGGRVVQRLERGELRADVVKQHYLGKQAAPRE